MVKIVTQFQTTTGKSFEKEFDAWAEELRDFLMKNGADNDAIARKIVQAVTDGQPETLATLADIVDNMDRCAPLKEAPEPTVKCDNCGKTYFANEEHVFCSGPAPVIAAGIQTAPPPLPEKPCLSPVACSRNEYGICTCYN